MSNMKMHSIRLQPKQEVKTALEKYVTEHVSNGCHVLSCCGSVTKATLRMAKNTDNKPSKIETFNEHFEVLAMSGTLSASGTHLHICLSNKDGGTLGGHVVGDLEVFTTMEVLLGEPTDYKLTREFDSSTGFKELVVSKD